jgi:outer membrane protein TolC
LARRRSGRFAAAEALLTPPPDLEELLESVERHPAIRAQDHRIEAAQAEIALGEDEYRPAWSLEVYYANRPEFSDMICARVNFDLPLFTADRQDRRQGARLALRDESLAQREDALRALRADAIESLRQRRPRRRVPIRRDHSARCPGCAWQRRRRPTWTRGVRSLPDRGAPGVARRRIEEA